jgi:GntR family transcriptional regulator
VTEVMGGHDHHVPPRPRVPEYQRIAAELRAKIERGDYARDVALPSATALAAEYDVSPRTAHRAVRILVDQGVLMVVPNYGTFLA